MATVLLFHHVQGLTPGVRAFADRLRDAGHVVHAPDLFDGRTFASIAEGFAFTQSGELDLAAQADAAADALPADTVYAGISLGVMQAQRLAQTRPGARRALFFEACVPPTAQDGFGPWPAGLVAQIHGMDADEFFVGDGDADAAREIVSQSPGSELYLYPGEEHLFTDSSLPSFDAEATAVVIDRVVRFLERVEA